MMRRVVLCCFWLGVAIDHSPGQTNSTPVPVVPATNFDFNSPAEAQVPGLRAAWLAERDPAKRSDLAGQLVTAVIHEYDKQQPEVVDEVARDGAPQNELSFSDPAQNVAIEALTVLTGVHANPVENQVPVFRRMTLNRMEAWISTEGWLFDGKGKLLFDVKVLRRDGTGRDWFGAFLPDGSWITTDLWSNDEQLNCFSPGGKWQWEVTGKAIVAQLPKAKVSLDHLDEPIVPSIGWARVDKTSKQWLVCLGLDYTRGFAKIGPKGQITPLDDGIDPWQKVYPRSMGVRGMFTALYIDSDDGKVSLHRNEAGHGAGVGWPSYSFPGDTSMVIGAGNDQFGFWPRAHDVFIEADGADWQGPHHVWFFSGNGKYQGEMVGSELGDAANGRDLLVHDATDAVAQVGLKATGPAIVNTRRFTWPDGTTAVPLAIYDDLKLGFFLRGPGMQGATDDARKARSTADVVMAKW